MALLAIFAVSSLYTEWLCCPHCLHMLSGYAAWLVCFLFLLNSYAGRLALLALLAGCIFWISWLAILAVL
jgi:hypothetical protein